MHWGFETSNVYMAEKSRDWNTAPYWTHVIIAHSNLTAPSPWDRNNRTALMDTLSSVFPRSDVELCGPFPHPKHVVWRGLENSGSVLWFGFLFVIPPPPQEVLSASSAAQTQDGCRPVPLGRLSGAGFLSVSLCKEESQYLWAFRDSVFLLCLSNGCSHFY